MELLGHLLGPKWSQKRQDEGLKSDLGSSRGGRGSQRLSMGRFWEDVHHLLCAILYFGMRFVRKVLCMQFGTLTWIRDVFAFISAWHFH